MEYQDLSPKMQTLVDGLKHASSTADNLIRDCIEEAAEGAINEEEFAAELVSAMEDLAQLAYWWGKSVLDVSKGGESLPHTMKPMFQIE